MRRHRLVWLGGGLVQKHHMVENLGAFHVTISERDMGQLDDLNEGYSALGSTLQYREP